MNTEMQLAVVLVLEIVAHVYCGQNLALNKPTWMSAVYAGSSISSAAENSVDGHLGTNWHHGVCSSTADNDRSPWIVIDLLGQYEVHNVTIYNRGDHVPERLHDFVIEVYRTNPSRCSTAAATVCKAYVGVFGLTGNVQCESSVLGRFVRIWKPATSQFNDLLTVCEVEVYGIRPGACIPTWHQGVRGKHLLSPGAASFPQQSRMTCFLLCVMSETCVGVNYNGGSKECQLISKPMPTDPVSLNQDWVFFGDDLC
ncbi:fucolectin-like [Haliotis rubra]|uniref:fucolectin-like n=1 Tax=Haliotis rubra TaxID=36100 RepID=UPI001EE6106F|nr:fucolectin-like [Haliotis rubra]